MAMLWFCQWCRKDIDGENQYRKDIGMSLCEKCYKEKTNGKN